MVRPIEQNIPPWPLQDGQVRRRTIRTGRTSGEDIEVLSGLREGEESAVPGAGGFLPACVPDTIPG